MLAHAPIVAHHADDNKLRKARAHEFLTGLGIEVEVLTCLGFITNRSRLHQLRGALHNRASIWFEHSESDKDAIEAAITALIGKPKEKQSRERGPVTNLNFSGIVCDPALLAILVSRFPRRPYCCDEFYQNSPRRLDAALTKKYIQYNPPQFKSFIVVDIDRAVSADECKNAGLPPPTWTSINPVNGHGHFSWGVEKPVWTGGGNQKPARFFEAVQEGFRAALRGDEGFAHLLTKNPIHAAWLTSTTSNYAQYDLAALASHVDLTKVKPRKKKELVEGLGRNCLLFDATRQWAYSEVSRHSDPLVFGSEVQAHVERLNALQPSQLLCSEVLQIGRSISKWTWAHKHDLASGYSKTQAVRGKRSGKARLASSQAKRLQAIQMLAAGDTHQAIAARLGITTKTVQRWSKL